MAMMVRDAGGAKAMMALVYTKVKELADQHPDRIYQRRDEVANGARCSYHPDERNPDGCIMGAALRAAGYSLPESMEGGITGVMVRVGYGPEYEGLTYQRQDEVHGWFEGAALGWFSVVQGKQDEGKLTWAECVAAAGPWPGVVSQRLRS